MWMGTAKPKLSDAHRYAEGIKAQHPEAFLAYNLSPSFNWFDWDAADMTDQDIVNFQIQLDKAGFVWQFITLAGFHGNALSIDLFTRNFEKDHMREELKHAVETPMRQSGVAPRWSTVWCHLLPLCHLARCHLEVDNRRLLIIRVAGGRPVRFTSRVYFHLTYLW